MAANPPQPQPAQPAAGPGGGGGMACIELARQPDGTFMVGVTDQPSVPPQQMQPAGNLQQAMAMIEQFYGQAEPDADEGGGPPDADADDAPGAGEQRSKAMWDEENARSGGGKPPAMGI